MKLGFTLKELFYLVIVLFGIGLVVLFGIEYYSEKVAYSNAVHELRQMQTAVYAYQEDNKDSYPVEVSNALPSGLDAYLRAVPVDGEWPSGPFPGSYYDWDDWSPDDLMHPPFEHVRQISIRFCSIDGSECFFPNEEWAAGFDQYSAVYLCLEGPCRAHASQPVTHPGIRVN